MNGYSFSERVRQVLELARDESVRLKHEYVGTEHMILGLVREGSGVGATILENLSAPLDDVRRAVESLIRPGFGQPWTSRRDLPYTSRARKVLELAMSEAAAANHSYVGTEHLLLGLLAEGKGVAAQVLTSFGVTIENARTEMRRMLAWESLDPRSSWRPRTYSPSGQLSPAHGPVPASAAGLARVEIVMAEAAKAAVRAGATHVEPIHVAIGLLAHREGTAIAAIERMGCDIPRVAAELETLIQPSGSSAPAEMIPIGPNLAPVLTAARNEQRAWGAPTVATHHLLIAVLETCPDVAEPFGTHGITPERLRDEAKRLFG